MTMLLCNSKFEVEFAHAAVPDLERLGVSVLEVQHVEGTGVLHVELKLPAPADRKVRLDALRVLSAFEHGFDHAVVTDPTFVWDDELDD